MTDRLPMFRIELTPTDKRRGGLERRVKEALMDASRKQLAALAAGAPHLERRDIQVPCRAGTPEQFVQEMRVQLAGWLENLHLTLALQPGEAQVDTVEDHTLTPEVWQKVLARVSSSVKTSFNHSYNPFYRGQFHDVRLRPGERGLLVPGTDRMLQEFFVSEEFLQLLPSKGRILNVEVTGDYMNSSQVEQLYGKNPKKKAIVEELRKERYLPPTVLWGLLRDSFENKVVDGTEPARQLLNELKTSMAEPGTVVLVNAVLHPNDPSGNFTAERVNCYAKGADGCLHSVADSDVEEDCRLYYSDFEGSLVEVCSIQTFRRPIPHP